MIQFLLLFFSPIALLGKRMGVLGSGVLYHVFHYQVGSFILMFSCRLCASGTTWFWFSTSVKMKTCSSERFKFFPRVPQLLWRVRDLLCHGHSWLWGSYVCSCWLSWRLCLCQQKLYPHSWQPWGSSGPGELTRVTFGMWHADSAHHHELGGFHIRDLYLIIPEDGKSKVRVVAWLDSWWGPVSWCADDGFPCTIMWQAEHVLGAFSPQTLIPSPGLDLPDLTET